MCDHKNRQIEN